MGKITGYAKAKFLTEGTIIDDLKKRQWIVGRLLDEGGFGAIYTVNLVADLSSKVYDKVIKIEPAKNGPLYTEVNFYMRVCGEKEISNWMVIRNLKFLGMPRYISGGMQANNDNRFLVMDRYGDNLHKILMKNDLSPVCILQIAINILDVLEYIHSREYSHADIKALNILQGYKSAKEVYLLDFGMVTKYISNGVHRPEKPDPKVKHNGTLEFCPRDSHRGLVSCRRSDVESLMFNLIFWLSWDKKKSNPSTRVGYGNLPWLSHMKNIGDKPPTAAVLKQVAESKEKYMKDTNIFVEEVGLNIHSWSSHLVKVLKDVSQLKYSEEPKYDNIREDFVKMICEIRGKSVPSQINLNLFRDIEWDSVKNKPTVSRKRFSLESDDYQIDKPVKKKAQVMKRILEVNNSSTGNDVTKETKSIKKTVVKKIGKTKDSDYNKESTVPENIEILENRILKSAWSKIPGAKVLKDLGSKENLISVVPETQKSKKSVKYNIPEKVDNVVVCNGIIPGMKALNKLKSKGTRSSPRIISSKGLERNCGFPNIIQKSLSVSCQTSPSLSVKL